MLAEVAREVDQTRRPAERQNRADQVPAQVSAEHGLGGEVGTDAAEKHAPFAGDESQREQLGGDHRHDPARISADNQAGCLAKLAAVAIDEECGEASEKDQPEDWGRSGCESEKTSTGGDGQGLRPLLSMEISPGNRGAHASSQTHDGESLIKPRIKCNLQATEGQECTISGSSLGWELPGCPAYCRGSDQVLGEPGEGVVPGGDRLLLVVARAGVVVEGVLGAGIDLDLIGDAGGLERSLEVIPALVGEIARIVG